MWVKTHISPLGGGGVGGGKGGKGGGGGGEMNVV